jgi:hypothetical protein
MNGKEVKDVFAPIELEAQLRQERLERDARRASSHTRIRQTPAPTIRRAIGRRLIAFGGWIAAEAPLEQARSA